MKARTGFDAAIKRAEHLLHLYELLSDSRSRRVRTRWAVRFKTFMRWPLGEQIVRVDGRSGDCLLILRERVGLDRKHFTHDYLSELLRAAVVAAVSALDRYLHDLVVQHSIKLLSRKEADIPQPLARLAVPALEAKRALEKLRSDPRSRPGHLIKRAIQAHLHREFTFQNPDSVLKASRMLGIANFWSLVASRMPGSPKKEAVIAQLRQIAERRNHIVHEADLLRKTKSRAVTLRDIEHLEAERFVVWVRSFVAAIDDVVTAAV